MPAASNTWSVGPRQDGEHSLHPVHLLLEQLKLFQPTLKQFELSFFFIAKDFMQ